MIWRFSQAANPAQKVASIVFSTALAVLAVIAVQVIVIPALWRLYT